MTRSPAWLPTLWTALTAAAVVCLLPGVARAALITFDGAAAGSPYGLNSVFASEGVNFQVDAYNPIAKGSPTVTVGPLPFGLNPGADPVAYPNNLNLDVDFAGSIGRQSSVSILYAYNGGTVNLHVNGAQIDVPASAANFLAFHGQVINGVSVSAFENPNGVGRIDLAGPIDRVVFGGQETIFDSIRTIPIPEPSSAVLLGVAAFLVAAWAARRGRTSPPLAGT
jgi:hypothetical protein